jgi:hypothetical protein
MDSFDLNILGDAKELKSLKGFCTRRGITVQHNEIAVNTLGPEQVAAVGLIALRIIAKYEVISKCITAWRKTRKPPPTIRYFSPPDRGYVEVTGEPAIEKAVKSQLIQVFRSDRPRRIKSKP